MKLDDNLSRYVQSSPQLLDSLLSIFSQYKEGHSRLEMAQASHFHPDQKAS